MAKAFNLLELQSHTINILNSYKFTNTADHSLSVVPLALL